MKTLTVRLPEELAADIESESRAAGISRSDVVRQRLEAAGLGRRRTKAGPTVFELAADLIGSLDDKRLPSDLSAHRTTYLRKWRYGKGGPR